MNMNFSILRLKVWGSARGVKTKQQWRAEKILTLTFLHQNFQWFWRNRWVKPGKIFTIDALGLDARLGLLFNSKLWLNPPDFDKNRHNFQEVIFSRLYRMTKKKEPLLLFTLISSNLLQESMKWWMGTRVLGNLKKRPENVVNHLKKVL